MGIDMFQLEKKILQFCERHIDILSILGASIMGILIRWSLRYFHSGDASYYLLDWYEQIKSSGGFRGLGEQVGTYNVLYQTIIAFFTYLPINPLIAYKLLSVIFDYILAGMTGYFVYHYFGEPRKWKGILAYTLVLLSPIVFVNSAMWGQCDSIYAAFMILSFLMMVDEKYTKSLIFLGIALAFKLQAAFLLPLYLFIYFYKRRFSILKFAILPVVLWLSSLPGILAGRHILDVFLIYYRQSRTDALLTIMYPSFWVLFTQNELDLFYDDLKPIAMLFTIGVLAIWMVYWLLQKVELNAPNMVGMALISFYTCILFLPGMHERYGFVYEILALIYVFYNSRSVWLLIVLNAISFSTYGQYICDWDMNLMPYSIVNVIAYIGYAYLLVQQLKSSSDKSAISL